MSPRWAVAVSPALSNSRNARRISLCSSFRMTIASVDMGLPPCRACRWGTPSGGGHAVGVVLAARGDRPAQLLDPLEVDLGERRERLDRVGEDVERDLRTDGERGLLQP